MKRAFQLYVARTVGAGIGVALGLIYAHFATGGVV